MSLGTGALAVIGGTVVIVGFLTLSTGALIAVQGYNQLSGIGVEALTGFLSAYVNVRIIAPATAGVGIGRHHRCRRHRAAGRDADQRGDRRTGGDGHPVDRLPGVHPGGRRGDRSGHPVVLHRSPDVVSRGAVRHDHPSIGQSAGVYDHYFNTFLNPTDLIWSFVQAIAVAIVVMLVHTYYGYTALGGPAGVGEAVGRAVRTSLIAAGLRRSVRLAGHLRPVRQLQPVRVVRWPARDGQEQSRIHPAWWTLRLIVAIAGIVVSTSVLFTGR